MHNIGMTFGAALVEIIRHCHFRRNIDDGQETPSTLWCPCHHKECISKATTKLKTNGLFIHT